VSANQATGIETAAQTGALKKVPMLADNLM
jgi:hypothetical protein